MVQAYTGLLVSVTLLLCCAFVFNTNKLADDNYLIPSATLTHHQSESISITSNHVRNDWGSAALHQSSKGAVSWLWLPRLAGFISYRDEIFIKGTSYFPGKRKALSFKTAYIINQHLFQHKRPILATVRTHTHAWQIPLSIYVEDTDFSYLSIHSSSPQTEFSFSITDIAIKGRWTAQ